MTPGPTEALLRSLWIALGFLATRTPPRRTTGIQCDQPHDSSHSNNQRQWIFLNILKASTEKRYSQSLY